MHAHTSWHVCVHVCPRSAAAQNGSLTAASCDWWSMWLKGAACGARCCCEGVQHVCGTRSSSNGRRGVHLQRRIKAELCVCWCFCHRGMCSTCQLLREASGQRQALWPQVVVWTCMMSGGVWPQGHLHTEVWAPSGQTCVAVYSWGLHVCGHRCRCFIGPWGGMACLGVAAMLLNEPVNGCTWQ